MVGIIKRSTGLNSRDLEILQNKNKGVSLGKFLEGQKLCYSSSYPMAFYFVWYMGALEKYLLNEWMFTWVDLLISKVSSNINTLLL